MTLRSASREAILGRVRVDRYDEVELPESGDVQRLLPAYCAYWHIDQTRERESQATSLLKVGASSIVAGRFRLSIR
ncbi:MAG TPA: hypothetical protein VLS89_05550 [Candidatus Nanopelagicales bacterium]|nr:hypothetical protein [Candidatus Nanopelagicales bacterium]